MQDHDIIPYIGGGESSKSQKDGEQLSEPETPKQEGQSGGESVERIREIIFGGQMRDYDRRFQKLEQRLGEEMRGVQSEVNHRLQMLEDFMKREFSALGERLESESTERSERLAAMSDEMRKADSAQTQKSAAMESQQMKLASSLRDLLLEQSNTLLVEIGEKHKSLADSLMQQETALRESLTDKRALADLFSELSIRLARDTDGRSGE